MKMIKRLLVALAAVLLLAVGGCYDEAPEEPPAPPEQPEEPPVEDPEPEPEPEPEEPEEPKDPEAWENEDLVDEFIESISFDPYWQTEATRDSRRVVNLAAYTCITLDAGSTIYELARELDENESWQTVEIFLEAAIYTFCPQYVDNFEAFTAAHSE